jgi:ATP-dependent Zn protease
VVEQDYNILMACQKQLCEIAKALNERTYLNRDEIEKIVKEA